jgi:hypothetical protein
MKKTLLILLIFTSVAKADPFSDIWKWVEDSPEIAVPALVLGAIQIPHHLEYQQNRPKDSIALKVLAVSSSHWWQQRCKFASLVS